MLLMLLKCFSLVFLMCYLFLFIYFVCWGSLWAIFFLFVLYFLQVCFEDTICCLIKYKYRGNFFEQGNFF